MPEALCRDPLWTGRETWKDRLQRCVRHWPRSPLKPSRASSVFSSPTWPTASPASGRPQPHSAASSGAGRQRPQPDPPPLARREDRRPASGGSTRRSQPSAGCLDAFARALRLPRRPEDFPPRPEGSPRRPEGFPPQPESSPRQPEGSPRSPVVEVPDAENGLRDDGNGYTSIRRFPGRGPVLELRPSKLRGAAAQCRRSDSLPPRVLLFALESPTLDGRGSHSQRQRVGYSAAESPTLCH
jgi:hypothetical protein